MPEIGGNPGGRSTYGECLGALSWIVKDGRAGNTDLADMRAVLASRYHDNEPRSPWTFVLFVDARGDRHQRQAMADIFTGVDASPLVFSVSGGMSVTRSAPSRRQQDVTPAERATR